jgi:apolipoprotein D and lipocalin family protein
MHAPTLSHRPAQTALAAGALALAGLAIAKVATSRGIPRGLAPVRNFVPERYAGLWHEIARFDYRFERGLERVTAEYTLVPDGRVRVHNRGFDPVARRWKEARGIAKAAGEPGVGALRVSFFGPFYAPYNIIELDDDYHYAMVTGPSRKYLWILSRAPHPPESVITALKAQARAWGFDTDKLVDVRQG